MTIDKRPGRMTAREVLVRFGGKRHALHSAAWRDKPKRRAAAFLVGCSCGVVLAVENAEPYTDGLRNVPKGRPS